MFFVIFITFFLYIKMSKQNISKKEKEKSNLIVSIYSKKYLKAEKNKHKRRVSLFICTSNID